MDTREINLDARAQQRVLVLTHVMTGELSVEEAATYLQLSTRQVRRLVDGFRAQGVSVLVHGNRGRPPANLSDAATRGRIVELARTTYAGFNPAHLAEVIATDEAIEVSARTVRRILIVAGIARPGPAARRVSARAASGCRGRACSSRPTAAATTGSRVGDRGSPSWPGSMMRQARSAAARSAWPKMPLATLRCSSGRWPAGESPKPPRATEHPRNRPGHDRPGRGHV
ncbi:MAG: helix-turn-helix domain-containing protein [Candidatus Limnocylindrales bacterium]